MLPAYIAVHHVTSLAVVTLSPSPHDTALNSRGDVLTPPVPSLMLRCAPRPHARKALLLPRKPRLTVPACALCLFGCWPWNAFCNAGISLTVHGWHPSSLQGNRSACGCPAAQSPRKVNCVNEWPRQPAPPPPPPPAPSPPPLHCQIIAVQVVSRCIYPLDLSAPSRQVAASPASGLLNRLEQLRAVTDAGSTWPSTAWLCGTWQGAQGLLPWEQVAERYWRRHAQPPKPPGAERQE